MVILIVTGLVQLSCNPKKVETKSCFTLKAEDFQKTINGKQPNLYFLKNGNIQAAITNYGGRIVGLCIPDKVGKMADVVLGFSSINGYLNAKEVFHGTSTSNSFVQIYLRPMFSDTLLLFFNFNPNKHLV